MTNAVLSFLFIATWFLGSADAVGCALTNNDAETQAVAELLSKDLDSIDNHLDQMRMRAAKLAQTLPEFAELAVVRIIRDSGLMDGSTMFVVAGQPTSGWSGHLEDRTYAAVRIRDAEVLSLYIMDRALVAGLIDASIIK